MEELTVSQVLDLCGFPPGVLDHYDLEVPAAQPVRKVVRLRSPSGDWALKRFKLTTEELSFSLAAMKHLRARGFAVPKILPARDGRGFVEMEDGIKYFVMEWLNGRESSYGHVLDLALAARGLALFHQSTRGFSPPPCPGKEQWGTWTGHFLERIEELREWTVLAEQGGTPFDHMFAAEAAYGIQEASRAVELLLASPYEEISRLERSWQGFCHHDYAHHNVLITREKQISLIDFDYAICDIRAHDLASLILRNMKSSKWDMRTALFIIKSYFENAAPHPGEERLLHAMMRFPQDLYESGYFRYVEKNRPIEFLEGRMKKWKEQKDWRERVLRDFEEGARHVLTTGRIR